MEKYQRIGVSGFLSQDKKVLILKRSEKETFLPGAYELPGGKVEFGESPKTAIEREFQEEVGLSVQAHEPVCLFSYTSDNGNRHTVDITFIVELKNKNQEIFLSTAHNEFKWINKDEIGEYVSGNMREAILAGFKHAGI